MIIQEFPGPGIFKKKIQAFPGGMGTLCYAPVKQTTNIYSNLSAQRIKYVLCYGTDPESEPKL